MLSDYHIHTNFSSDSKAEPQSMIEAAIQKGLPSMCITDHHDLYYPATDENTLFFLVFESDSFVGQIRFKRNDIYSEECVISLSISESFRGKHISEDFIRLGICELQNNWKNIKFIIAEVKDDNIASNKLFSNMEFELVSTVNTYKFNTKL